MQDFSLFVVPGCPKNAKKPPLQGVITKKRGHPFQNSLSYLLAMKGIGEGSGC